MTGSDDELLDRLRAAAAAVDAPPPLLAQAGRAALSTRRLDEELAELVADSDLAAAGAVRAGIASTRLLSFESESVAMELQLADDEGQVSLRGLVSGATGPVQVETGGKLWRVELDESGWFVHHDLAPGPFRLRLGTVGGAAVATAWVLR